MKYFIGILLSWVLLVSVFAEAGPLRAMIINEILPSPEGADAEEEWIEIFNQGDLAMDLSGWKIEDVVGKTKTHVFPKGTIIEARGFLILRRPISKITLNNEGDGLKLFRPNGVAVDSVNYSQAPQGQSYNLTSLGWLWSGTLTPGAANAEPKQEKQPMPLMAATGEIAKQSSGSWLVFLAAIFVAIFSGIIILALKRKVDYNKL